MTTKFDLKELAPGDIIKASFLNALTDVAKRGGGGILFSHDGEDWFLNRQKKYDESTIRASTSVDIPARSIISLNIATTRKSGEDSPYPNLAQYDNKSEVFYTSEYPLKGTASIIHEVEFISASRPYYLAYDDEGGVFVPTVGSEVGPKEGQWTLDQNGVGFTVLNDPDTTNKRVWVQKRVNTASVVLGTLNSALAHNGTTDDFNEYKQVGTAPSFDSGESVKVINETGVELQPGILLLGVRPSKFERYSLMYLDGTIPPPAVNDTMIGTLAANLCPTDASVTVNNPQSLETCETFTSVVALNTFHLSAISGNLVLIKKDHCASNWRITQVFHQSRCIVANSDCVDIISFDEETCSLLGDVLPDCSIMSCSPVPVPVTFAPAYTHNYVEDIQHEDDAQGGNCSLQMKTNSLCSFKQPAASQFANVLNFKAVALTSGMRVNGLCIDHLMKTVWVISGCTEPLDEWVEQDCGELCP